MKLYEFDTETRVKYGNTIAGCDEAGRGPLAGPVCAAAVVFSSDCVIIDDINDSKKLTHKKRETLYDAIVNTALSYSIAFVDNDEIDRTNILRASLSAMKASVEGLEVKPDAVLVDGIYTIDTDVISVAVTKGDSLSYCVAAASILAKVARDRVMVEYDKVYGGYGFAKHKGYPTKEHYAAIAEYGACDIHRKSFRLF